MTNDPKDEPISAQVGDPLKNPDAVDAWRRQLEEAGIDVPSTASPQEVLAMWRRRFMYS